MKIAKLELAYALKKISVANGKNDLVSIEIVGDKAAITAFDGEAVQMQQTLKCTASEAENGKKYVVHFGKLQDVVSVWKDTDIEFAENGGLITLSAAKTKTQVALPFKTDMPELVTEGVAPTGTPIGLQQADLAKGIKELLPLVSDKYPGFYFAPVGKEEIPDDEKPFNAEEEEPKPATATRIWSTDGSRVHYVDINGVFGKEIFLPKVFCKVVSVLKGELTCVPMGDKYLLIKDNENTLVLICLLQKKMPYAALQGILDEAESIKCAEIEVTKVDLVDALNLIYAVTTDEQKRLSFAFEKGSSLSQTLSDTSGKGNTDIAGTISCSADMFAPTFSAEQLITMTAAASEDKIKIIFTQKMLFLMSGGKPTYAVCRFTA